MAARSYGGCSLTTAQESALSAVGINVVSDTSCRSKDLNTCGRDALDLVSSYSLYDPGKGVYTEWGDIGFSWDHENALSDEKWQVAEYLDTHSYRIGDEVIRVENGGQKLTLYEASSDVPVPAGSFDPQLWSEKCHIIVSKPVGLPSISDLEKRFLYFDPRRNLTRWGEVDIEWGSELTISVESYTGLLLTEDQKNYLVCEDTAPLKVT